MFPQNQQIYAVRMTITAKDALQNKFTFSSSISDDVWNPEKRPEGYEWWYFDALSDDGNEAVIITFLDNHIFSPRYNSHIHQRSKRQIHSTNGNTPQTNFPAVSLVYFCDGKVVYRALSEYTAKEFEAESDTPGCRIGANSFSFESAPYGSGYLISLDLKVGRNKHLTASFEWLSIESDYMEKQEYAQSLHEWNLVAPRSDVTGRISLMDDRGHEIDEVNFRGTGYHDHNRDHRWLPDTVKCWQRGRVHFPDATAVFYRYEEIGDEEAATKLILVNDSKMIVKDASAEARKHNRSLIGIKYPARLQLITEDRIRLRIKQTEIVESSFFYLRFLSEMTLSLKDGKPRKGIGITEQLTPKALKYRWLDWISGIRIGR